MLWIQYQTKEKLDILLIQELVNRIALLIAPFPVSAYNIGTKDLGLVFHDGVMDIGNRDTSDDESVDDNGDSDSDNEQSREYMGNDTGNTSSESLIDVNNDKTEVPCSD